MPSAAAYIPASKWTVVAAFVVAVALHAGAVVWVEVPQTKPTLEANVPVLVQTEEAKTATGTITADAAEAKIAAD